MKSPKRPAVPDLLRALLTSKTQELIDSRFKTGLEANAASSAAHGFNYIVDIYTQWRGRSFYICARYRNPRPDAIEEYFEVRTTRVSYVSGDRFGLSYMRHTGKWVEVYPSLTAVECVDTIEGEELFWPVH